MRAIIFQFLTLASGLLIGCQNSPSIPITNRSFDEKAIVLSTIGPIEVLVSAIAQHRVTSECLINGELDPHSYQLVKGDREKIRRAKLVLYNGLGLEHGPSLAASLAASPRAISLGEWIQSSFPHAVLKTGGLTDPHLWMDIALWSKSLELVCSELCRILPDHSDEFRVRADQLRVEFQQMHEQVRNRLQSVVSEKRYLMTTHDAFRYFGRAYLAEKKELENGSWQKRIMSPEGLAPESQVSMQQMRRVLDYLTKHRLGVVFAESNVNSQSLAKLVEAARSSGLSVRLAKEKLYGDAMPPYKRGPESYRAYFGMIWSNADVIARHLSTEATDDRAD